MQAKNHCLPASRVSRRDAPHHTIRSRASSPAMDSSTPTITHAPLCDKCEALLARSSHPFAGNKANYRDDMTFHADIGSLQRSASTGCYTCVRIEGCISNQLDEPNAIIVFAGSPVDTDISHEDRWEFCLTFTVQIQDTSKHLYHVRFIALEETKTTSLGMRKALSLCTRTPSSMRQARAWIKLCCKDHQGCGTSRNTTWFPRRLVHVVRNQTSSLCASLRRREALSGSEQYLTLSHRWGGHDMAVLTSGTISNYEVSVPVDTLSRVFQDAIHVTAALGYAYIWIDSLCIVQDDEAEWQGESEAMHTIYRNAVCNLAASEFENGEEGLLNDHRARNPIGPVVNSLWSRIQAEGSASGTAKSRRQAAK